MLFRLKKRKLEAIYRYLSEHHLLHDKEPLIADLQTHRLGKYLLSTIYPGYSAARARNFAYRDYRECREKEYGTVDPLAYDYVPTTEMFERLDEVFRVDVNWQNEERLSKHTIKIPVHTLKKSIDRIDAVNDNKSIQNIEYHLYLWNSTKTLLKPLCKSLIINSNQIWTGRQQKLVNGGFMHIDISQQIKQYVRRRSVTNEAEKAELKRYISVEVELADENERNISHISICAVIRMPSNELVSQLYMQTATEIMYKSIQSSPYPLITQQMMIQVLKQKEDGHLDSAEDIFMTCMSTYVDDKGKRSFDMEMIEPTPLQDPLTQKRLQHPVKSIFCKHKSCFDASTFFDHHADLQLWHCPICFVQIKHLEELRMDYLTKLEIEQYHQAEPLYIMRNNLVLTETELFAFQREPYNHPLDTHVNKRLKTLAHVQAT
ncbi:hypothetical protein G6F70_005651 [Rhizopus microsporus]|nr:hypothetical protein G6F71_005475 [Rhizopus microsporus]KAG1198595.1 hypothetical protein G6F70_005651 [Rhizopus microsporus]KAG1210315.1 hypothetical protein G6F69_005579 [Rhizopus microsporus]KAG1232072.1 hypothetical protein G6F67_005277 [Rhizopus microsporus]KAG1264318.1 hypothetical protein G6F68_004448 [Rhizopus microsporus]